MESYIFMNFYKISDQGWCQSTQRQAQAHGHQVELLAQRICILFDRFSLSFFLSFFPPKTYLPLCVCMLCVAFSLWLGCVSTDRLRCRAGQDQVSAQDQIQPQMVIMKLWRQLRQGCANGWFVGWWQMVYTWNSEPFIEDVCVYVCVWCMRCGVDLPHLTHSAWALKKKKWVKFQRHIYIYIYIYMHTQWVNQIF